MIEIIIIDEGGAQEYRLTGEKAMVVVAHGESDGVQEEVTACSVGGGREEALQMIELTLTAMGDVRSQIRATPVCLN